MMRLSEFDFLLPESLIALRPAVPRPASRLLVSQASRTTDAHVADLANWLRAGDLLIFERYARHCGPSGWRAAA